MQALKSRLLRVLRNYGPQSGLIPTVKYVTLILRPFKVIIGGVVYLFKRNSLYNVLTVSIVVIKS